MESSIIQDFALGICLDCGLLRQSLAAGEAIPPGEILSLGSAAEAIYITACLESRTLDRIGACHKLWSQTAQLFEELAQAWVDVASGDENVVEDQNIQWLRGRIAHFAALCQDRVSIYTISETDRRKYREGREIGSEFSFSSRSEIPT
jgi:hypothetical protein